MRIFDHNAIAIPAEPAGFFAEFELPDGTFQPVRWNDGSRVRFATAQQAVDAGTAHSRHLQRLGTHAAAIFAKARENRRNAR